MIERTCLECGAPMRGRMDKKFCSDQCRSTHNNRRNSEPNKYVREVNNALRKNRRILDSLNPGGKVKVSASCLKEKGFDFRYLTSIHRGRDGGIYHYCYDQGYVSVDKNYFLIVLKEDQGHPLD